MKRGIGILVVVAAIAVVLAVGVSNLQKGARGVEQRAVRQSAETR